MKTICKYKTKLIGESLYDESIILTSRQTTLLLSPCTVVIPLKCSPRFHVEQRIGTGNAVLVPLQTSFLVERSVVATNVIIEVVFVAMTTKSYVAIRNCTVGALANCTTRRTLPTAPLYTIDIRAPRRKKLLPVYVESSS